MRKSYFSSPTAAEIKRTKELFSVSEKYIDRLLNISDTQALIISDSLIPEEYVPSRKFFKHGRDVKIKRFKTLEQVIVTQGYPSESRKTAFDNLSDNLFSGYTFKPIVGTDKTTKKIPLVECFEGAKLYCYANQDTGNLFGAEINVKPYDDSSKVVYEGAEIILKVPSREKQHSRYEFKFSSVPVADHQNKFGIGYSIKTDHVCGSKRFNIRYNNILSRDKSKVDNFCAHEIAGYFSIIDSYKEFSLVPYELNQFAIPNPFSIEFYNKLDNNCLIQNETDKRPRKLNRAEKEILLWELVKDVGHDALFKTKGKLRDFSWNR
ncbi:hypothetical protein HOD61_03310 [archaeon]|jgi:hypothetical protein|nr:hypothetical protein [archaeon]